MLVVEVDVFAELGTRQHCRDNVTMFSGQIIVYYCVYIRCGWLLHLDTEAIQFLYFVLSLKLYYAVTLLSSCNCREAKQLLRAQLCSVCILFF